SRDRESLRASTRLPAHSRRLSMSRLRSLDVLGVGPVANRGISMSAANSALPLEGASFEGVRPATLGRRVLPSVRPRAELQYAESTDCHRLGRQSPVPLLVQVGVSEVGARMLCMRLGML